MRNLNQNIYLFSALACGIIIFSSFSPKKKKSPIQPTYKSHTKFISRKTSPKDLYKVMASFQQSLGMGCEDCHARSKTNPKEFDFASDAKSTKKEARKMMEMVARINKKNFGIKGDFVVNLLNNNYAVSCYTCHRGKAMPLNAAPKSN